MLKYINFSSTHYNPFLERKISGVIDNYELTGRVDFMVASGEYEPIHPYFYFSEYKREKGSVNDPLAQLLGAMIVGQQLNNNNKPVYGAYIIGRNWFFLTLKDRGYCKSEVFAVTRQEHLEQVFTILMNVKKIIEEKLI